METGPLIPDTFALAARCHAEGNRALAAGNWRAGLAHYEQALRLRPDFVEAYNDLGMALQHFGEWARAAQCYRQAIHLMPSFAPAYNNMGNALRAQGQWAAAATAFEEALRLQPDSPEIAFNLASTHHDQGELDKAVLYYRQALRLRPEYVEVSNSLATAFKEQGLLDEAIAQCRETLKLEPDHALSYYNLSELAAEGRYQFAPEELGRIKSILASANSSTLERSLCCFALGTVLNKQGCYDEAFGYYQRGNEEKKQVLQGRGITFDAEAHRARTDRMIACHGRSYFERVKKWGTATDLPVFIIGMPRSGSTLVEQILASHPRVFGGGEIGDLHPFIAQFATKPNATPQLPNIRAARKVAADYLRHLAVQGQGAGRVTVKTLENFLHLGVIATLFPRARIIHCRRDPIDTCLSCYFQNFQNVDFACSLEDIGAYYNAYETLMAHWSRVLPLEIHEVRYEELIQDQEAVTRKLLSYCGLDWDERCLAFYETRRAVRTASAIQVRKPISGRAIGRWRHYRSHLGPLFRALGRPVDDA